MTFIDICTDFVLLYIQFFSLLNLQIPNSHETADSPVDAIPKTNNKLIDWSKVSNKHICTLLIFVNSQYECNMVTVFYIH
jgi:hypothetical protein